MPNTQHTRGPRDGGVARLQCLQAKSSSFTSPRRAGLCAPDALLACLARPAAGQAQTVDISGNPQARAEALRAIPFDELNEASRGKLRPILERPSLYRRMPTQEVDCDPDLHVFLIRYPEVIVNIWQLMEVTRVQVKRTGPYTFDASDGSGTVCQVELVYGRPGLACLLRDRLLRRTAVPHSHGRRLRHPAALVICTAQRSDSGRQFAGRLPPDGSSRRRYPPENVAPADGQDRRFQFRREF
jgi:hypothetical protein